MFLVVCYVLHLEWYGGYLGVWFGGGCFVCIAVCLQAFTVSD